MDLQLIDDRIKTLKQHKSQLLGLKKAQRGNQLKELNSKISRLNRWKLELSSKLLVKAAKNAGISTEQFGETIKKAFKQNSK